MIVKDTMYSLTVALTIRILKHINSLKNRNKQYHAIMQNKLKILNTEKSFLICK